MFDRRGAAACRSTWKKVYAESHKNGVLVNEVEPVFLEPTDYSAIK
jgi:hypothetical protein